MNFANNSESFGSGSSFASGGKSQPVDLGQIVTLDENGIFSSAKNGGAKSSIEVDNKLQNNSHAILQDQSQNNIFVNTQSGMDIGTSTLTPKDEYQIWFGNHQENGSIIANNVSNPTTVSLRGEQTATITYTADGTWEHGSPDSNVMLRLNDSDTATLADMVGGTSVIVSAAFKYAVTTAAVTYLTHKFLSLFATGLKPTSIHLSSGNTKLDVKFDNSTIVMATVGVDAYEQAVNNALIKALKDPQSGLKGESWEITDKKLGISF